MDKGQKTTRRAKREFKVIHGAEYAAFCKMRLFGVRTLDEVRGKLRNVDAAIDILKNAAAIGDFVRFRGKVFAVSEIESAELIEPRESHDKNDKYFYGVKIRLKARNNATGAQFSFEKCSAAEFDAFAERLGA